MSVAPLWVTLLDINIAYKCHGPEKVQNYGNIFLNNFFVLLHRVCYGNDRPPNIETTKMSRKKSNLYPLSRKSIHFTVQKKSRIMGPKWTQLALWWQSTLVRLVQKGVNLSKMAGFHQLCVGFWGQTADGSLQTKKYEKVYTWLKYWGVIYFFRPK